MNWYTNNGSSGQMMVADEATGRTVALVYNHGAASGGDAALIAAAPDLLATLRHIRACALDGDTPPAIACADIAAAAAAALAAIDKAEGRA